MNTACLDEAVEATGLLPPTVPSHKHGGGWTPKISKRSLNIIRRQLDDKPTLTARELKEQSPILLQNVHVRTNQKAIRKKLSYRKVTARKKPFVTDLQCKKRVTFAKKYSSWTLDDWRRVLWTDESTFCVSESKGKKVWRVRDSDPCNPKFTRKTVKHPASLMVWGEFSYGGSADLIIFPKGQTVTKVVYLHLLENKLAECFAATGSEVLQQDGAPAHTAKVVKQWLYTSEVECISDWPSSSPDNSPIENLWAIVKQKLTGEDTSTLSKLEVALRRVWSSISPSTHRKLVDTIPDHLLEVKKRKGYPIN
ncbi:hypothetical protein Pcinc_000469 [Petrolisthes cinctipes]|uniref:Tc1-like transposase DDE domain-containing protein n=1 Tax=Petrolisthes cinctipes TaxID=88211 RepID=A0AAE1L6H4_PETCI|nr:hypothetical protein Pcinc_000469 [Petrolisthes cinctipes]